MAIRLTWRCCAYMSAIGLILFQLGPDYNSTPIPEIIRRDKAGEFPRILRNPIYRDTVPVSGKGGYTIIRFKADNPGKT